MKNLLTVLFLCIYALTKAQSGDITVPYNTMVSIILSEELKEGKNKVGTPPSLLWLKM
ncbi:MAG: hypothetical protein IPP77_03110 [Bacteroidetes bacterium]|nr:hypothetical protein [Bacteroidota bacterium]